VSDDIKINSSDTNSIATVDGAPEVYPDAQKMAEDAAAKLRPIHPFLENAVLPMHYEANKHDWLVHRLQGFLRIQGELSRSSSGRQQQAECLAAAVYAAESGQADCREDGKPGKPARN
jgi:hypothetical protein